MFVSAIFFRLRCPVSDPASSQDLRHCWSHDHWWTDYSFSAPPCPAYLSRLHTTIRVRQGCSSLLPVVHWTVSCGTTLWHALVGNGSTEFCARVVALVSGSHAICSARFPLLLNLFAQLPVLSPQLSAGISRNNSEFPRSRQAAWWRSDRGGAALLQKRTEMRCRVHHARPRRKVPPAGHYWPPTSSQVRNMGITTEHP